MERESLRLLLAQGQSVEQMAKRFGKHPSTIAYWMAKHGLVSPNRERHAARGEISRERLEGLVARGLSIAEIAAEIDRSKSTVRFWLRKHGLRTRPSDRIMQAREARSDGLLQIVRMCPRHGETEFVVEGRGYYRCKRCRSESISEHRRRRKQQLVIEAGGRCQLCGYARCVAALEFHHIDPESKSLGISERGLTLSLEALRTEAAKCVLLCSNCHVEVENGVAALPVKCPT